MSEHTKLNMSNTNTQESGEESGEVSIDTDRQFKLKIANVLSFIIAMIFNGAAQGLSPQTLREQNDQWDLKIAPASYAFSIWGLIYTLIAIFVVYQALPDRCVPSRNNDVIVNKIGYVFAINMLGNALWLVIFGQNKVWSFIISLLVIIGMLTTQLFIMMQSVRSHLGLVGIISLRCGFSIYSGWVTAATILNASFVLKSLGLKDPSAGWAESTWTIIILWVAFVIYATATFRERNPLFGLIYIWVLLAIRSRQSEFEDIQLNTMIIVIIHAVYLVMVSSLVIFEKAKGKSKMGLLY